PLSISSVAPAAVLVRSSFQRCDVAHSRRHLQLFARLRTLDAAARLVVDCAGRAVFAEADRNRARLGRSKVELGKKQVESPSRRALNPLDDVLCLRFLKLRMLNTSPVCVHWHSAAS